MNYSYIYLGIGIVIVIVGTFLIFKFESNPTVESNPVVEPNQTSKLNIASQNNTSLKENEGILSGVVLTNLLDFPKCGMEACRSYDPNTVRHECYNGVCGDYIPITDFEINVYARNGLTLVKKALDDNHGNYSIELNEGQYVIFNDCSENGQTTFRIKIVAGQTTIFNIFCHLK